MLNAMLVVLGSFVVLVGIFTSVVITGGKTARVLETFGKPHPKARMPGLGFKLPFPITTVAGKVDLRQTQKTDYVKVRAKDNAFITLPVTAQLKVIGTPEGAVKAFYELDDPLEQIMSYVLEKVKDAAAELTSEEMYSNRGKIKNDVIRILGDLVRGFGYELVDILVDEPKLTEEMQSAFEEVKSSEMLRKAAQNKAEAARIEHVGVAKAEKESQKLKGEGIADMRRAIAEGVQEAMNLMIQGGMTVEQALNLLMDTNRLDTIISAANNGNLVLMDVNGSDGNKMAQTVAAVKAAGNTNQGNLEEV